MKTKKYRAGKLFNKFLKLILGHYMRILFDYHSEGAQIKGLKPPYIIIANHTNFWDPFLLSMCIPDPVYFVTSDAYFRNPVLKQLLKLVGAIPKTKSVSDPLSIRGILGVIANKGVVGIFPEGKRNWDGKTLPLLRPTAKLVKALNVPVVSVLFRGACLSMPRWANSTRRGKLTMTLSRVLETQDIKQLTVDEIFSALTESLSYDEYEYQQSRMNPYRGRRIAEKLELFLFWCPECGGIGTLGSSGNVLACRECSYDVTYNEFGFFESAGRKLHYGNPRDWNIMQLERLDSLIASEILSGNSSPLFTDNDIILKSGHKTGALHTEASSGRLSLFADRVEYSIENQVFHSFHIGNIIGENIQFNNQLEFIYGKVLYRFCLSSGNLCAYKWVKAIETIKKYGPQQISHAAEHTVTE